MSMQTWTTYAYGVMDEDVNDISMNVLWPVFYNIEHSGNTDFTTEFEEFCEDEGISAETFATGNLDEPTKIEPISRFITEYYERHYSRVCYNANALVLAQLVAMFLGVAMDHMVVEGNENGQILVGIGLYYPWEIPPQLKNASQEDYERAFLNAYAILGIDGHDCAIDHHSMEDWG